MPCPGPTIFDLAASALQTRMHMRWVMTLAGAKAVVGNLDQAFVLRAGDVFAAGAVADFALHRSQVFGRG